MVSNTIYRFIGDPRFFRSALTKMVINYAEPGLREPPKRSLISPLTERMAECIDDTVLKKNLIENFIN